MPLESRRTKDSALFSCRVPNGTDLVLVSGSSASGKSLLLTRLGQAEGLGHFRFYEPDQLRYWLVGADADQDLTCLELLTASGRIGADLADNIRASDATSQMIKLKFGEFALAPRPTVAVLPQRLRYGQPQHDFLRLLAAYANLNIRHVLVSPTWPQYLRNLRLRHRGNPSSYRQTRGFLTEQLRLAHHAARFDLVFRPGRDPQRYQSGVDVIAREIATGCR